MSWWVDAALAGLGAGTVAVAATLAIERWGGLVGGLLATLPSTIVPATLGLHAQSSSPATFRAALYAVPAGMLVNALFLWLWRVLPPRLPDGSVRSRLALMITLSLFGWATAAALAMWGYTALERHAIPLGGVALALTGTMAAVGVVACWRPRPSPKASRAVGPGTLIARGLLAGLAIATSVWLAQVGGELLAGMAAVFPAIFLTAMVSLWLSQGEAVPAGAVGPMMLGSSSVAVYALVASLSLPAWGPWGGSAVAWLAAALSTTAPATWWLRGRS